MKILKVKIETEEIEVNNLGATLEIVDMIPTPQGHSLERVEVFDGYPKFYFVPIDQKGVFNDLKTITQANLVRIKNQAYEHGFNRGCASRRRFNDERRCSEEGFMVEQLSDEEIVSNDEDEPLIVRLDQTTYPF